jgi:hypothetical protein
MPRKIGRVSTPKPARAVRRTTAIRRRRRTAVSRDEPNLLKFDNESVMIPTISGPQMNEFRGGEYLHVSDLIYKCIRKIAISEQLASPMPGEPIYASQGITFALGHAVEDFVIQRIMEKSPEYLWGTFECACGKSSKVGVYSRVRRSKSVCKVCSTVHNRYKELTLKDEEHLMVGNVDIVYYLHAAYYLCELKSMAANQWNVLEAPKQEHLIQILMYWWMARRQGMDLYDKVSITYVNKEYRMANPYKEFVIQPSKMMHRIEPFLEDAKAFASFRQGEPLPPRVTCGTDKAPEAKKCHVARECFAL